MQRLGRDQSGFTVAELVISAAVLLIVSLGIMGVLGYATSANANTAKRENALDIANQRLEQARTMPYADLGTVNGYPSGTLPANDTVGVYTVTTEVSWAIDPLQNISSCKTVRITVSWGTGGTSKVSVETNVAGKSDSTNVGDVKITVTDVDTSKPVQGCTVTIQPSVGPSSSLVTKADGTVRWGKIPQGNITITGSCLGYAIDYPKLAGVSVTAGRLNEWPLDAIKPSTGIVNVTFGGAPLSGVDVTISGPSGTITKTSDGSGKATFTGLLKGTYTVTGSKTGYTVGTASPLAIIAGNSTYSTALTMNKATTLKVTVVDDGGSPLSGATVSLSGAGTYSATTDANGEALFTGINAGSYSVSASKNLYVSPAAVNKTVVAATDNVLTPSIILTEKTKGTLIINFTFGATDAGSYTIRICNSSKVMIDSFTVNKPTGGGTVTNSRDLDPGTYYVTCKNLSPWPSNPRTANITVGNPTTVNMTKSN